MNNQTGVFHRAFSRPESTGDHVKQFVLWIFLIFSVVGVYCTYRGFVFLFYEDIVRADADRFFWRNVFSWALIIANVGVTVWLMTERSAYYLRGREKETIRETIRERFEEPEYSTETRPVHTWQSREDENGRVSTSVKVENQLNPEQALSHFSIKENQPKTVEECNRVMKFFPANGPFAPVRKKLVFIRTELKRKEQREARKLINKKEEVSSSPIVFDLTK